MHDCLELKQNKGTVQIIYYLQPSDASGERQTLLGR